MHVVIGSRGSLRPSRWPVICEYGVNWRLRQSEGRPLYEFFYPPSRQILISAEAMHKFHRYEVLYDEGTWSTILASRGSSESSAIPFMFSSPMDQLLFVPRLANKDGFLVHACGGVIDGKAYVFAGHSGDGKTTLSRILASEGVELLSDERVAIRNINGTFMAYGTPWPGEGGVFSPAGYPLAGVFLLRKARRHRVRRGGASSLAAELIARSIVPYYLRDEAERILTLVQDLAGSHPLHGLEFAPEPGLVPLLLRAA